MSQEAGRGTPEVFVAIEAAPLDRVRKPIDAVPEMYPYSVRNGLNVSEGGLR